MKPTPAKASGYASILLDNKDYSVDVDAVKVGNEFRFLNDSRETGKTAVAQADLSQVNKQM